MTPPFAPLAPGAGKRLPGDPVVLARTRPLIVEDDGALQLPGCLPAVAGLGERAARRGVSSGLRQGELLTADLRQVVAVLVLPGGVREPDLLAGRVGLAEPGQGAGLLQVQVGAYQALRGVPQAVGGQVAAVEVPTAPVHDVGEPRPQHAAQCVVVDHVGVGPAAAEQFLCGVGAAEAVGGQAHQLVQAAEQEVPAAAIVTTAGSPRRPAADDNYQPRRQAERQAAYPASVICTGTCHLRRCRAWFTSPVGCRLVQPRLASPGSAQVPCR